MIRIPPEKLKKILISEGLVTAEVFDNLAVEAERLNQQLSDVLISKGVISYDYFYALLAKYFGVEIAYLEGVKIDENILNLLSLDIARQKRVIIFKEEPDGVLDVAMEDPSDLQTVEFLETHLKRKIKVFLVKPNDLEIGFAIYNRRLSENFKKIIEENIQSSLLIKEEKIEAAATALPVVAIVENFISYATSLRASDIHIEVLEDKVLVRFRIDGVLHEITMIPKEVHPSILARIKLLAGLKIDEHYKPQDGRLQYKIGETKIDIRVAVMPTLYGEKIEMRLLPAAQKPLSLEELGMLPEMAVKVKESLGKTYGMTLVCGPTGSGKTTTLYSILNILNKPDVNIVTIEDPIEYYIKYINQTQINSLAGITFATALRSFLRQDPNIIMVGEIRDEETAEIGIHAALTGHLLLSSLHTNDAPTAIPRFIDMKVPPFLVAAVLNIIVAQRLVRKICLSCIESYSLSQEMIDSLKVQVKEFVNHGAEFQPPKNLYRGKGCPVCNNTGYQGRMGIFEILDIDTDIRTLINSPDFSLNSLLQLARKKGMVTMFEDGLRKAELGQTTIEEIMRVIRE
ncbi:type II/IV secretion system protein [Candidatus Wolfebacteria bacterium]|nr:type II/IV secretion system protein [Candidatus Wolfebacteria bacterium]